MKPIATIILNRNLPKVTDKLYRKIKKNEGYLTDIFVVEAGSLKENLSKYATWHVNTKTVRQKGSQKGSARRASGGFPSRRELYFHFCHLTEKGRQKGSQNGVFWEPTSSLYSFLVTHVPKIRRSGVRAQKE